MQSLRLPIILRRVWWWKELLQYWSFFSQIIWDEAKLDIWGLRYPPAAKMSSRSCWTLWPSIREIILSSRSLNPRIHCGKRSSETFIRHNSTSKGYILVAVHFKWPSTFCSSPRNSSSQYLVFNFVFSKVETFVSSGTDEVRAKRDPSLRN